MARKPRKAAKGGKARTPRKASGRRRGVNPLALVIFLLVLAAGGGVAWLSFTYEPPLKPGMPGNDLVMELGDETKVIAKPKASDPPAKAAEQTTVEQADDNAPDAGQQDDGQQMTASGDDEPKPDDGGAADTASDQPGTDDQGTQVAAPAPAPATSDTATDDAAAPATDDQAIASDTGDQPATPAADQGADQTADGSADQGTPAPQGQPQGQPQRQPVGQQTAMRLNVPQPSPGIRPRIAIVLTGLGLSKAQTNAAIQALPANITFAFSPYGNDLQSWADQAREAGHEVLLELPMEPHGFPNDDPGPHTLLTSLTETENVERMTWVLDRFTGYVGVTSQLGGRFTTQPESLRPILVELKKRGLLFLDTRKSPDSVAGEIATTAGLAHADNDVFLDEAAAARATIRAGLDELERIARERGSAIGIGYPFPVTMEILSNWARDLEGKDIELLPVSALARLPAAQ